MSIRWNPALVREALDRMETALDEAQPFLDQAAAEASKAEGIPNLPGYISGGLMQFQAELSHLKDRCRRCIDRARESIPSAPVARTKEREGPRLI